MSTYKTQITIVNDTNYTFTLDTTKSSGIDTKVWPSTINGKANLQFSQGWDFQIKFTGWYTCTNRDGNEIGFDMYADEAEVFDDKIETDPSNIYMGSSADATSPFAVTFTIEGKA